MAADMHIHVLEGITEKELALFFSSHVSSKHFSGLQSNPCDEKTREELTKKIDCMPNIWIGALNMFDADDAILDTVGAIEETIGEDLPVIDEALIGKIVAAFGRDNNPDYPVANPNDVHQFLESWKGKRVFFVYW